MQASAADKALAEEARRMMKMQRTKSGPGGSPTGAAGRPQSPPLTRELRSYLRTGSSSLARLQLHDLHPSTLRGVLHHPCRV